MYNKNHGRFTSVDPLATSATRVNPQSFNRYAYVLNNPLFFVDPSGMIWVRNNSSGIPSWIDDDKYDKDSKDYTAIPENELTFTHNGNKVVLDRRGPSGDYAGWSYGGERIGFDGNPLKETATVIVTSGNYFGVDVYDHASVFVSSGEKEEPFLYDPSGSYTNKDADFPQRDGTGIIRGNVLDDYTEYHLKQADGNGVTIFQFKITSQEGEAIDRKASELGETGTFDCARNTSTTLQGIGPFRDLSTSRMPGSLANELQTLPVKPKVTIIPPKPKRPR
jgi:hypothetical protein